MIKQYIIVYVLSTFLASVFHGVFSLLSINMRVACALRLLLYVQTFFFSCYTRSMRTDVLLCGMWYIRYRKSHTIIIITSNPGIVVCTTYVMIQQRIYIDEANNNEFTQLDFYSVWFFLLCAFVFAVWRLSSCGVCGKCRFPWKIKSTCWNTLRLLNWWVWMSIIAHYICAGTIFN